MAPLWNAQGLLIYYEGPRKSIDYENHDLKYGCDDTKKPSIGPKFSTSIYDTCSDSRGRMPSMRKFCPAIRELNVGDFSSNRLSHGSVHLPPYNLLLSTCICRCRSCGRLEGEWLLDEVLLHFVPAHYARVGWNGDFLPAFAIAVLAMVCANNHYCTQDDDALARTLSHGIGNRTTSVVRVVSL